MAAVAATGLVNKQEVNKKQKGLIGVGALVLFHSSHDVRESPSTTILSRFRRQPSVQDVRKNRANLSQQQRRLLMYDRKINTTFKYQLGSDSDF